MAAAGPASAGKQQRKARPVATAKTLVPPAPADPLACAGTSVNLPGTPDYVAYGFYPRAALPPNAASSLVCAQSGRGIGGFLRTKDGYGRCGTGC